MAAPASPLLHVTSQRLGSGTSASVHIAHLHGRLVAAKLSGPRESARRQCRREARRYARFRHHRCITRCLGVAENAGTVVLVTELMQGGSLFDALAARSGALLPRSTLLRLALDVADAVAFIHRAGYSCGDIKTLNVLLSAALDPSGALRPGACAKLCDFGLSRRLHAAASAGADTALGDRRAPDFMFHSTIDVDPNAIAGTFAYLAPEAFEAPPRTAAGMVAADVYALAVVLWELATVQVPWGGHSLGDLMRAVRDNRRLVWPPRARALVGSEYVDVVERCWHRDPARRPNAADIVAALRRMYDAVVPTGEAVVHGVVPDALLSCSDVSECSGRDGNDDDGAHSIVSSIDSCAITEIESDEDGATFDNDSFDIPISLFPYNAQEDERECETMPVVLVDEERDEGESVRIESQDGSDTEREDGNVASSSPRSDRGSGDDDQLVPKSGFVEASERQSECGASSSSVESGDAEFANILFIDSISGLPLQQSGIPIKNMTTKYSPSREGKASAIKKHNDETEAKREQRMWEMQEAEVRRQQEAAQREKEEEQRCLALREQELRRQQEVQKQEEVQKQLEAQRERQLQKHKEMYIQKQNMYMWQWRQTAQAQHTLSKPRSYKVPPLTAALKWELRIMEQADITPSVLWSVMQYSDA